MNNPNWQTAGAYKAHRKKSQSKRTSPRKSSPRKRSSRKRSSRKRLSRKRLSRKPSKKQLAALAKGRAIRAKNIKKRRSGQKKQRGGAIPITELEKLNKRIDAGEAADKAAYRNRNNAARLERERRRKEDNEASAKRVRWPWS